MKIECGLSYERKFNEQIDHQNRGYDEVQAL